MAVYVDHVEYDERGNRWVVYTDGSRAYDPEITVAPGMPDGARTEPVDDGSYQATIDAVTQDNGSDAGSAEGDSATGLGASLDGFVGKNHKWLWVALVALGLVMVVASHKRRR
ncbi:hypothetical protein [Paramagnetospirillum marisnigri]|uniref:hypothetical protein n=1 Tax=Paramagnetospirillum marisnigri TaxID=1285242 RepID=UPI0008399B30|nr:hypothetical protein [Paramagnetospirillum marisnigri]